MDHSDVRRNSGPSDGAAVGKDESINEDLEQPSSGQINSGEISTDKGLPFEFLKPDPTYNPDWDSSDSDSDSGAAQPVDFKTGCSSRDQKAGSTDVSSDDQTDEDEPAKVGLDCDLQSREDTSISGLQRRGSDDSRLALVALKQTKVVFSELEKERLQQIPLGCENSAMLRRQDQSDKNAWRESSSSSSESEDSYEDTGREHGVSVPFLPTVAPAGSVPGDKSQAEAFQNDPESSGTDSDGADAGSVPKPKGTIPPSTNIIDSVTEEPLSVETVPGSQVFLSSSGSSSSSPSDSEAKQVQIESVAEESACLSTQQDTILGDESTAVERIETSIKTAEDVVVGNSEPQKSVTETSINTAEDVVVGNSKPQKSITETSINTAQAVVAGNSKPQKSVKETSINTVQAVVTGNSERQKPLTTSNKSSKTTLSFRERFHRQERNTSRTYDPVIHQSSGQKVTMYQRPHPETDENILKIGTVEDTNHQQLPLEADIWVDLKPNLPQKIQGPGFSEQNGFRSRYSLRNKDKTMESGTEKVHLQPTLEHYMGTEEDWIEMLQTKLQSLEVQQLLDQQFEEFLSNKSPTHQPNFPPAKWYSAIQDAFGMLKSSAMDWETAFSDNICLPDDELQERVKEYKSKLSQRISSSLPEKIQGVLSYCIQEYAKAYENRNSLIQNSEASVMDALIRRAVKYYWKEMQFFIEGRYYDSEVLQSYHEEIFEETRDLFLEAAGLKHKFWRDKYTASLQSKLKREWEIRNVLHDNNKAILRSKLYTIKEDAVKLFKAALDEEKHRRVFNPEYPDATGPLAAFDLVSSTAKGEATKKFLETVNSKIGNQNRAMIQNAQEQLYKDIDIFIRRKLEEVTEIQRKQDEARRKDEEKAKQRVFASKGTFDGAENPKAVSTDGGNYSIAKNPQEAAEPGPSSTVHPFHPLVHELPPSLSPVTPVPSLELAIHFGLSRTLVGIFPPGKEEFQLLASVENYLYFEDSQFLSYEECESGRKGIRTSFKSLLLDQPVNTHYYVKVGGHTMDFRIEDFVSYLFATLKWRAERLLVANFSRCVICVPQCLNSLQNQAVRDGAALAGFSAVKVINDTNAIALAHLMESRTANGDVVVVNTSEGFIDAAYFTISEGIIMRRAISGKYFTAGIQEKKSSSYWPTWPWGKGSSDPFKNMIKQTLCFKLETKNQKFIKCESSHLIIVGNGEYASRIASAAETSFRKTDCVDLEFPIKGASYFARLQNFNPEDPICKRWLDCGPSEDIEIRRRLKCFKDYYCTPATFRVDSLNYPSTTKGMNLSAGAFKTRLSSFFLRSEQKLHSEKMGALEFAWDLRTKIINAKHAFDFKNEIIKRIESIAGKIQHTPLTLKEINSLYQELEQISTNVFASSA